MRESTQRLKTNSIPALSTRTLRLFLNGNPLSISEVASSPIIRTIHQITPSGGP